MGQKNKPWRQSEDLTASIYGARVPGSGSGVEKLDVQGAGVFKRFRIENKFTEQKGYRLTVEEVLDAKRKATAMGKEHFWVMDFNGMRGVWMLEDSFLSLIGDYLEQ